MKKLLLIPFLLLALVAVRPHFAYAFTCDPACPSGWQCIDSGVGDGSGQCFNPNDTTGAIQGGVTAPDITPKAGSGQVITTQDQTQTSQNTPTGGSQIGGANQKFVPLTGLPGLQEVAQSNNFSGLLNAIYKICIGIAAAIAVLQIIRAGIMYMGGDSFSNKEEARSLIGNSIMGLILVLSPVIVFGLINPRILTLQLNTGVLQSNIGGGGLDGTGLTADQIKQNILWTDTTSSYADAKARCDSSNQGAVAVPVCIPASGSGEGTPVTDPSQCAAGQKVNTICMKPSSGTSSAASCTVFPTGNTVLTTNEQAACCAQQDGCSAQVGGGYDKPTCICTAK